MCRFLLMKAHTAISPVALLQSFADMAQQSHGADGVWQGDGWGITWLDGEERWQLHKSLAPIWLDRTGFTALPASRLFLVHARSASFPHHKDVIDYNQPYHDEQYAFVFNGLLRGVKLPQRVAGQIGAQKIWRLLQNYLTTQPPVAALTQLHTTLVAHTQEVKALNIGLMDKNGGYTFCSFATNPDYYTLQSHRSAKLQMICSEPLAGYAFDAVAPNQVVAL